MCVASSSKVGITCQQMLISCYALIIRLASLVLAEDSLTTGDETLSAECAISRGSSSGIHNREQSRYAEGQLRMSKRRSMHMMHGSHLMVANYHRYEVISIACDMAGG